MLAHTFQRAPLPLLGLLVTLAACEPTGGRLVAFQMESAVSTRDGGEPTAFVNDRGWRITLDRAQVATAPLYLFADPTTVARRTAPSPLLPSLLSSLLLPTAHAHPGDAFFGGGEVLGEWPDQWLLDAHVPDARVLGETAGIEGEARSAALLLMPPLAEVSRAAPALGTHVAVLEGEAEKDGTSVPFALAIPAGADLDAQRVGGIPATLTLAEGASVRLTLLVDAIFAGVDFTALAEGDAIAQASLETSVRLNLRRAGTWRLTGEAPIAP